MLRTSFRVPLFFVLARGCRDDEKQITSWNDSQLRACGQSATASFVREIRSQVAGRMAGDRTATPRIVVRKAFMDELVGLQPNASHLRRSWPLPMATVRHRSELRAAQARCARVTR